MRLFQVCEFLKMKKTRIIKNHNTERSSQTIDTTIFDRSSSELTPKAIDSTNKMPKIMVPIEWRHNVSFPNEFILGDPIKKL